MLGFTRFLQALDEQSSQAATAPPSIHSMRPSMSRSIRPVLPCVLFSVAFAAAAHAEDADTTTQPSTAQPALPQFTVVGNKATEDNYRVESVDSLGPLGSMKLIDTPYSVGILSSELLQNSQATNFKDVSKYLPLVAYQEQQGADILRPQTRGIQGGNFQNSLMDGMAFFITVANAIEQFQQIEVVNGAAAPLYGPANPSGMFNFVSKRPTAEDLREVTVSYASDSIGTAHVDLGGKIDNNGVVSYRFNGLFGEGDAWVDRSHAKRVLGSLAMDVRPLEDTVIETNYSYYHLVDTGYPGWFSYGEKIILPPAPDPENVGYGHQYAGQQLDDEWRQIHLVARQRLRAALRHDQRCRISRRQFHCLGNGTRPDHRHRRIQGAILLGDHAGQTGERAVGDGDHRQPRHFSFSGSRIAQCRVELRFLYGVSARHQCGRHHSLHRCLGNASRGEPGLVSHRQFQRQSRQAAGVCEPWPEPQCQPHVQAREQHDGLCHFRQQPAGRGLGAGRYDQRGAEPRAVQEPGIRSRLQGLAGQDRLHRRGVSHPAAVRQHQYGGQRI